MHMNKRKDKDWLKIYWCGTMIQILLICIIRFCLKALTVSYPDYLNFLFIAVGGTSSAVWGSIVAKKSGKVQRYRQIIKYFFQIKQSVKYYVIVLCFLLILFGPSLMTGKVAEEVKWYSFIMIFIMAIVFGGIEEIGWRYTFQPLLEKRLPYEIASIITFVSWGLWHYMYFYVSDSLEGIQHISFLFGLLTSCFVLGAIYRVSNSLWLCVLYHCLLNTFSQTLVASEISWSWISIILCITIAIVIGRKRT